MHCHFVICRVLVDESRLHQSGDRGRSFWWHENLLDNRGHHSSVAAVLLERHRVVSLKLVLALTHQIQGRCWRWNWWASPFGWRLGLLIFLACLFLGRFFLLILFVLLVFRHELAESYTDRVLFSLVGIGVDLSYDGHARNHGQVGLEVVQNVIKVNLKIFIFLLLSFQESHKHLLLLIHANVVVRFNIFVIVLRLLVFFFAIGWSLKLRHLSLSFKVQFFDEKVLNQSGGARYVLSAVNSDQT
jgi:hypothetical protein